MRDITPSHLVHAGTRPNAVVDRGDVRVREPEARISAAGGSAVDLFLVAKSGKKAIV